MKEKYFKNQKLLDAKLGPRPFFIWRSQISLLKLVKIGLGWRVGNEKTIKI